MAASGWSLPFGLGVAIPSVDPQQPFHQSQSSLSHAICSCSLPELPDFRDVQIVATAL